MPQVIIALLILFGGHWLIKQYSRATPQQAKKMNKNMAGGAAIAFSAFLALRGAFTYAVPLFAIGLGLLGKANPFPNGFNWGKKSEGQKSRVATSILAMELDHDTQSMRGEVLAGPLKGKSLEHLNTNELESLYQFCGNANDQSVSLLEAWLDRNRQEWRNTWSGERKAQSNGTGSMTRDEAFSVLGLKPNATQQDIKDTHRRLMKEFHPDRGGSDYLAAKINQAKDILLQD
jgi:DnaJ-domain-containing protein 1